MKTIILLSFVCAILTIISCQKKEYTCQCGGGITGNGTTVKIEANTRSQAEKICNNRSAPNSADGYHSCELK